MSKFLGPIHFLMYEKIKFQDRLTASILSKEKLDLLNKSIAPVSTDPLDEIIDVDNIHGYLSSKIDVVESRLSYAILHGKDVYKKAYDLGVSVAPTDLNTFDEVFDAINMVTLDGMPCDHAVRAGVSPDGELQIVTLNDMHKKYSESPLSIDPSKSLSNTCEGGHGHDDHESFHIGSFVSEKKDETETCDYYVLRENFLKGFLSKSKFKITRVGKDFYIS